MKESIYARLLLALAGHSRNGCRLKEIADRIGEIPSTTLRNLQRLEADGLAERVPQNTELWRLSPRIVQIALAHFDEVQREDQRHADFKNRYSRSY